MDTTLKNSKQKELEEPLPSFSDYISKRASSLTDKIKETTPEKIGREVTSAATIGAEEFVGAYGNLKRGLSEGLLWLYENARPPSQQTIAERFDPRTKGVKKQREAPEALKKALRGPPGEEGINPPTSEELHEKVTKQLLGNYTEPKSPEEKNLRDTYRNFASFWSPTAGRIRPSTRFFAPLTGEVSAQAVEHLGGGDKEKAIAKMATQGVFTLANESNARQFAGNALRNAENIPPPHADFSTQNILQNMNNNQQLQNVFTGLETQSKAPARRIIERIRQISQQNNGRIPVREAMQIRRDINEEYRNLGGFNINASPDRATARNYINELRREFVQGFDQGYGIYHPNFWGPYQAANEAFGVTQRSSSIANFISDNWTKPFVSDLAKTAFGVSLAKGALLSPITAGAIAGIAGVNAAVTLSQRIYGSQLLRGYYGHILRNASAGNAQGVITNLKKFDEEAAKEEKKEKAKMGIFK